jgi:hypothetical protein
VNADGTLVAGSGVTGVSKTGTGTYQVTFNRDVTNCAAIVTALNGEKDATAAPFTNFSNVLIWAGYDIFGSPGFIDSNFAIAVFC